MFIFKNKSPELKEFHQYLYDLQDDNNSLAEIYDRLDIALQEKESELK